MKNKRLNLVLIIVLLAVIVGAGVFAAVKHLNKPEKPVVKEESKTVQLLTFDTYKEVTGTKIRLENMFGRIAFNKDKAYITEGKGSIAVFPQGDYNRDDWKPYMQLDCSNTTFASSDFTDYQNITMDVYNDSDEEKQINVNFTIANYSENFLETPTITFNLKPNSWNECIYDISKEVVASYFNLANVRYMTIEFLKTVESEDDVPEALYLDNLYATKYDVAPEVSQMDYDFFEGVGFETLAEQYLMSGETAATNRLTLKRTSYEEVGMTAPKGFGEYLMSGNPEGSTWPSFMFHYGENVPNGTILTFWAYIDVDAEEDDRFVISSMSDGYENGDRVSNTVAAGERPFNQWFQVKILMNEDSDVTYSFFNFDDFETADASSRFGDKPVRIYIDNVKLEKAAPAVSVAEDGTVTLRNPLGDETVSYVIEKPFKKGEAVAFDIDFNTNKEVSIWVLAEGKWNTPTEVNEFYAKNFKTWDGKKMILADIVRDVESLKVTVKYFAKDNRETNVCTISNIRTAEPRVQVKANGDVVISNPAGEALYLYDVAIPVKAGKRIAFDIDFNTDEPLAVWILAERKYNTTTEKNEFLARGFEKWDGKKTLAGDATKDVKFFTIAFQYRGEGDFSKNVCTISNIRVVDPDVTVGSDGKVTIKNSLAQEFVSYDVKMPVKKGKAVRFDLDFNSADPVTVWVMAEGKWSTDTVKYEYFAKNFETGWQGRTQITAPATVDAEWFRIYIRYAGDTDLSKKICTIENIGIVDYVPNIVVDGNGDVTLNNQNDVKDYVIYNIQTPVQKGGQVVFDIDINSNEKAGVWVLAESKWNSASEPNNEFYAKVFETWEGKQRVVATAKRDADFVQVFVNYKYDGNTKPEQKVAKITDIHVFEPQTEVAPDGTVTLRNNGGANYVIYDVAGPFVKDGKINFDLKLNVEEKVGVFVLANGSFNNATVTDNEFYAKEHTIGTSGMNIDATFKKDAQKVQIYVQYRGEAPHNQKVATISNIMTSEPEPVELVNFTLAGDASTEDFRYRIKLGGLSPEQLETITAGTGNKGVVDLKIDGNSYADESKAKAFYCKLNAGDDYVTLFLSDQAVGESGNKNNWQNHTITIPAGAKIYDYTAKEDLTFYLVQGSVKDSAAEKIDLAFGADVSTEDFRYRIKLTGLNAAQVAAIAAGTGNKGEVTLTANGTPYTDAGKTKAFYCRLNASDDFLTLFIADQFFGESGNKANWSKDYIVTIPAGTMIYGYALEKDLTFSLADGTATAGDVNALNLAFGADVSTEDFRYRIKLTGLNAAQVAAIAAGTGNKGEVTLMANGTPYTDAGKTKAFYCRLNASDDFLTLFIADQFFGESGNKANWSKDYIVTIPAGTMIYGYALEKDLTFSLADGTATAGNVNALNLAFGADVSTEDFRYRIKLTGLNAAQVAAIAAGTGNKGEVTLTANGTPYTDAGKTKAFYCRLNASDDFLTLFIAEQFLGESGNKANWSKDYNVVIPTGTEIYGYELATDIAFALKDGVAVVGN